MRDEQLFGIRRRRETIRTMCEVARAAAPSCRARALDDVLAQAGDLAGFEPMDAGPLRIARYAEPLAYEGRSGPELAYRFEWFKT